MERGALRTVALLEITLLWLFARTVTVRGQSGPNQDNVIDLLAALNMTHPRSGVARVQSSNSVMYKIRPRAPHLTLPQEYCHFLYSNLQGSIGVHVVGHQTSGSNATVFSLSSASLPIFQIVSSTVSKTLRVDYQTGGRAQGLSSFQFPRRNPFSREELVQLAVSLEPDKLTFFVNCEEPAVLPITNSSLELPQDVVITLASMPGKKETKFNGYLKKAEISLKAYQQRPWICDNGTDALSSSQGAEARSPDSQTDKSRDASFTKLQTDHRNKKKINHHVRDIQSDQHYRGLVFGPPGTPQEVKPSAQAQREDKMRKLEKRLEEMARMLDMVKAQNADLQSRVKHLEGCECVRGRCVWEGREMQEGQSWQIDVNTVCSCTSARVSCRPVFNQGDKWPRVASLQMGVPLPDPCLSNPCQNGSTCLAFTSDPGGFHCSCPSNHRGPVCHRQQRQTCSLSKPENNCEGVQSFHLRWAFNPTSGLCEDFLDCTGNGSNSFPSFNACRNQCMLGACCLRKPRQRYPSEPWHYSQFEYNITSVNRTLLGDDNLIMEDEVWYSNTGFPHKELQDMKESPKQTNCTADLDFTFTCDYLTHTQCQALVNRLPEQTQVVSFSPGMRCSDVACGGGCGCFSQRKLWRSNKTNRQGCEDCTCTESGKVDCVCRHLIQRKEIRDLTLRERRLYQRAVRKLYAQPAVWKEFALLRAEFAPQAGHHKFFLPWHRYFLRLVEHELQSVSSCKMAIPYFEWTVDSGSMKSSAAWQAGLFGGDGEPETGCVPHHPFQALTPHFYWKPCLRRSFNSSVWLPDAVTLHKTINQADFQVFSQSLQTFSGLFRLWVGGHMASPLAAYDPLYLSHIAFLDKLWEQWQEKHQPAPRRETSSYHQVAHQWHVKMKPFDVNFDDVIFSQQKACIVYVPITIGAPCNITSFQTHPQGNPKYQQHSINKSMSHDSGRFDQYGYDRDGYDRSGWDRWGFTKDGFNLDSIDREGYDMSGFNRYGFNRSNVSWFGIHRNTVFEKKWMKEQDEEESDVKTHKDKTILETFRDNGYNIHGFDPFGLDRSGFDAFGFQADGYDKDGCNWFFNGPHYLRIYFHVQQQLLSSSDEVLAHITRTCPPITSLPQHWGTWDWMTFVPGKCRNRNCQLDQNWVGPNTSESDNMAEKRSKIWLPVTPDHRFCFKLHWYSGCPLGSAPITCPDLCHDARCHGYPQAVCNMRNCGSCFIEWRDPATGNHLICHDWPKHSNGTELMHTHKLTLPHTLMLLTLGLLEEMLVDCWHSCEPDGRVHNVSYTPAEDCRRRPDDCNRDCPPRPCPPIDCTPAPPAPNDCIPAPPAPNDCIPAPPAPPAPNDCTPAPPAPNDCRSCTHGGVRYDNGAQWRSAGNPCDICYCTEGNVQCRREPCNTPCKNPAPPPSNLCCPVCQACSFNGRDYPNGAAIPTGDRCQECHCVNGNVACSAIRCAALKCRNPVHHPGECCPRCDRCDYESQVYLNGQKFSSKTDPCIHCHCSEGEVLCDRGDSSCPPPKCSHPAKRKGECCPTCNECEYDRQVYADGKTFIPAGSGPCLQCRCKAGNVMCHEEKCPPVHCSNPVRDPHQCCPTCRGCVSNRVEYHEGAKWQTEDACSSCTCVNGEVVCSRTRCPAQQCQHPTRNRASCCATCDSCTYNSRVYSNGQTLTTPDQPCQTCTCLHGTVSCERRPCPRLPCANAYTPPGECCAKCPVCRHAGREYRDGEEFAHPTDPCRSCTCLHGNVQCLMRRCPPLSCPNPVSVRGECCPQCPAPPSGCVYERRSYRHMERFQPPADNCRVCNCHDGAVQCQRKPCPRASCSHPVAQECCQTCDACLYEGRQRANGETWEDASDRCSVCVCREGSVQCERQRCKPANCKHPVQRHCCMSCEGCMHRGKEYPEGSEFCSDGDPCSVCYCRGGEVACSVKDCRTDCSHPYKAPGQCCGECERCFYNNALLYNGQSVTDPRNPCTDCVCQSGSVRCLRKPCPQVRCPHPLTDQCGCSSCDGCRFQGVTYADGQRFQGGDKECQDCTCSRGEVVCTSRRCPDISCNHPTRDRCSCNVCDGCNFERRECFNGERFPHPDDHCQLCSCSNGAVSCQRRTCPVQCTHPVPSNDCCPVCDSCQYEGSFYSHGQSFTSSSSPCQSCTCVKGTVTCLPLVCPPTDCLHPVVKPGQCCPECPVSECMLEGQEFRDGQTWPQTSNPCSTCICRTGEVQCSSPQCPKLTCRHQVMDPATCCPRCRGCMYGGEEYPEGSSWFADSTPCLTCMCVDGVTTCSEVQCLSPCVNHITVPGECCPMCADCIFEGKVYGPGESFHPANDPCQICTCEVMPDGEQHLRCYRKQCPSLVDCPKNHILFSGPDSCCPVCAQPLSNCTAALIGNEVSATDDPCFTCHCKDLTWTCLHQACPPLDCPRSEQFNSPDLCCPVCKDCVIEGQNKRVTNGTSWTDSADDCVKCTCILGSVECNIEECPPVVCLIGQNKVKIPGKCCHECQDSGASCLYQGTKYHSNEQWEVDQCTSCTCVSGEVHCHSERCPPLTCATDEMPAVVPGLCCPHCIPRPATCVAFGDPHYRTFDGRMLHFQGTCTYVFAQDCDGGDFSVQVTNDDRGRKGVSWTKEVTVLLGDITVQLLQDWIVKVNNEVVALPFLNEPFIYIERQTNTILLNTNIGLKVLWSLRSHLEVSVPGSYKDQTCGLCGNFNNYHQDDLRMPSGRISLSESEFGNSWRVTNGSHSVSACRPGEDVNPCKEAGYQTKKGANTRCKVLKSAVFRPCHRVVPPEPWYAACVYDLCACGANSDECLCDTLEAYASQCREAGVILQWRSASLCAVGCPVERGFVFDECGPPCPVTCFNVDVPLGVIESHCFKPCVPGCQCPAGLVLHNNYCIQPEKCPKIIHGKS